MINTRENLYTIILNRSGSSCTIGSTQFKGIFKEIKDSTGNIDNKNFITSYNLKQGDIFTFNNIEYFVLNKEDISHGIYNIYVVRKCIHSVIFNFSTKDSLTGKVTLDYQAQKCLIESKTIGIDSTGKVFDVLANEIVVTMADNVVTNKLTLNTKFVKLKNTWEIQSIDRTKENLIMLHCKVVANSTNSDMEGEIYDRWTFEPKELKSYTLTLSHKTINIKESETQQITATIKESGLTITDIPINYSSDNELVATVNSNGLVTAVKEGTCNITVSFTGLDNKVYSDTVVVTITKATVTDPDPPIDPNPPTDGIVLSMTSSFGNFNLKKGNIGTYTPVKTVNGVEVPTSWVFGIDFGTVAEGNIEFREVTTTYIKLRSLVDKGTIILKATELDTTNTIEQEITLKPIW